MNIELSCECGNESEFRERTVVEFTIDGEGNRERKIEDGTQYFCGVCGKHAEVCEL